MLEKLDRLFQWFEDGLLLIILTAMILLALMQIVLRDIFDTGLGWNDPLLRILVLWLGLLGAISATKHNKHISIDLVSRILPGHGKTIAAVISNLFSAGVCGVLSYYASLFVLMDYQDGLRAFGNVPAWACEIIMPVGFGIMAVRFLVNAIASLRRPGFQQL